MAGAHQDEAKKLAWPNDIASRTDAKNLCFGNLWHPDKELLDHCLVNPLPNLQHEKWKTFNMEEGYQCFFCSRILKSAGGRTQHMMANVECHRRWMQEASSQPGPSLANSQPTTSIIEPPTRESPPLRRSKRRKNQEENGVALSAGITNTVAAVEDTEATIMEKDNDLEFPTAISNDLDEEAVVFDSGSEREDEVPDSNATKPKPQGPNTALLANFKQYCEDHRKNFGPLTNEEVSCVKLMHVLKTKKTPLNAYDEVLLWHLKEMGKLREHETLQDATGYCHRSTLLKRLKDRYNASAMFPIEKKVRLPSSKAVVKIPCIDAGACIVSLLTDPRFKKEDYLFWNDNPRSHPPEQIEYLADLNTGDAYLRSHEKLITKPNQILLPIIMYMDGATTGQFSDLPVTALKIALGIHKRNTRDLEHAWRTLAYIPQVRKQPARGKKLFKESGHLESQDVLVMDGEGDTDVDEDVGIDADFDYEDEAPKAQDLHSMLKIGLESFVELQQTGFMWDLMCDSELFPYTEFVLYVSNLKCDTEEGDLVCGHFTVRTKHIKHICRYCHCPTAQADNYRARYPLKTQPQIQKLVAKEDIEGLRSISQQFIQNAFYQVRFNQANERGIHGATPSEMLHATLLGIFGYLRDIFFTKMGEYSQVANDINGLSKMYGKLFTHQSDRSFPNTNFAKGIQSGKLCGKEYRGVLLIMAALLASTGGKRLLMKKKNFGGEQGLADWTLVVELLLEWEAFLSEPVMKREHVVRLVKKQRFIMYVIKQVAHRREGMGLKIMKYHSMIHQANDMLLYGVASEFDTGSNESHHKLAKLAALLTQRIEAMFDLQTGTRMAEFLVLDLAIEEIERNNKVWEYFLEDEDTDSEGEVAEIEQEIKISTGGTRIRIHEDYDNDNEPEFAVLGKSKKRKESVWPAEIVRFLNDLQNKVIPYTPQLVLPVLTEHRRGDAIFRAHPNHRGNGPWKDWAIVDWGKGYGQTPAHLWCFVELINVDDAQPKLEHGGVVLRDGVCAVVESAQYEANAEGLASDFFIPLLLDVEGFDVDGNVRGRKFYLADTEAIVGPCCVVPDIGGPLNRYLQVQPRTEWVKAFTAWLDAPHKDDVMESSDEET